VCESFKPKLNSPPRPTNWAADAEHVLVVAAKVAGTPKVKTSARWLMSGDADVENIPDGTDCFVMCTPEVNGAAELVEGAGGGRSN